MNVFLHSFIHSFVRSAGWFYTWELDFACRAGDRFCTNVLLAYGLGEPAEAQSGPQIAAELRNTFAERLNKDGGKRARY